jgi:hypothetical protein
MHRIYGIDIGSIFDRAALCLDHKPASLLHTLDTPFIIRGGQLVLFLTDNSFHLLDITNSVSSL